MYNYEPSTIVSLFSSPIYGIWLGIGVAILLILIIREVLLWYWKVNKIVKLLEIIEVNTRPQVSAKVSPFVNYDAAKPSLK